MEKSKAIWHHSHQRNEFMWKHSQSSCVIRDVLQNIHKPLGSASLSNAICPQPLAALVILGLRKVLPAIIPTILVLLSSMTVVFSFGWHAWLLPVVCHRLQMLLYCVHRDTITLGLDLFSGEFLNMLLFRWYPLIKNNSIYGVHQVRSFFVWKQTQWQFMKHHASLKNLITDKVPKNKSVPFNFSHATFSLLDFLILEDGRDKVSQNFSKELPLYAV